MKKLLLAGLFLSTVWGGQVFAGNFSETCTLISIKGSELKAKCKRADQKINATSLNLNKKIGNLDGVLAWDSGDFSHSCEEIALEGAILTAICKRKDGSNNATSLNLDEQIDNTNGVLRFD
jgi:CVNH domain